MLSKRDALTNSLSGIRNVSLTPNPASDPMMGPGPIHRDRLLWSTRTPESGGGGGGFGFDPSKFMKKGSEETPTASDSDGTMDMFPEGMDASAMSGGDAAFAGMSPMGGVGPNNSGDTFDNFAPQQGSAPFSISSGDNSGGGLVSMLGPYVNKIKLRELFGLFGGK